MFVKCSSHRSREKLLQVFPDANSYYYFPKLFSDNSKGYYQIPDDKVPDIKGISKPKDQNPGNYGACWE